MSPNRLAAESSPYLLQHKDNPVDWRPWGPEAFAAAREQGKPLLLSIGYSTCHWCHVMERESFSDPAVAAVMNRDFVCVKLDREERPDVDRIYMTAVQALTGQGGWPLNVFLTPNLEPFYGGTYFPPSARWGQPGWTQLLERIAGLWRQRRADVESDARRLAQSVRGWVAEEGEARVKPAAGELARADAAFAGAFDPEQGGFGGAPKFPMPAFQRYLLRRAARTGDAQTAAPAVATLRAMTRGGIFDQVGGGFHRYSTDAQWRVPHFEKMLYDNAQLLENLADAVLLTRDAELAGALSRTAAYLTRDLRGAHGGFFSAEDADSLPAEKAGQTDDGSHAQKSEGAFYLWTAAELDAALGKDAPAFRARHGVEADGNAAHDPQGEFIGRNILFDRGPSAMEEPAAARAREILLARRARRPRPGLDDKCLSAWNGLALSGLSRAFMAVGEPGLLSAAQATGDFLRRELASADGRTLNRSWRGGTRSGEGLADDYAYVAAGLLDLYEADFDPARLRWALTLVEEAVRRFAAPGGGLFQTAEGGAPELIARALEDRDGVEPSASAVLADAALRLHALTGRGELRRFADETLERFAAGAGERPLSRAYLLSVLDRALGAPRTVLIAGLDLPGGAELLAAARARLRPDVLVASFTAATQKDLSDFLPAAAEVRLGDRAAVYVCIAGACGLPVFSAVELTARLDA
ncbi:MAG: thioredoxin domain-containing protein [Elusimicrobia bacterium]|nr:thioredoxin domain-containing protein [Elusimicrobiota bacterium]